MVRVVPTSGQELGRTVHLGAREADGIFGTQTVALRPRRFKGAEHVGAGLLFELSRLTRNLFAENFAVFDGAL